MRTSQLVREQCQHKTRIYRRQGVNYKSTVNIRFDDSCQNGHNTFGITLDTYRQAKNGRWVEDSFGCQHDEVRKLFKSLTPYIKWHLTSTDGPMHYVANTIYWAKEGNLDYARKSAIWPEASKDQLLDEAALIARLPSLMDEFKKDMEALGFTY